MSTKQIESQTATQAEAQPAMRASLAKLGPLTRIARGVVLAGMLAAVSLTALPATVQAGNGGNGAAIGLGILGGVLAGAAIAATTPPAYAAPPSYYYYPPQGYYSQAPAYYYGAPAYYGPTAYGYPPPYNYQ